MTNENMKAGQGSFQRRVFAALALVTALAAVLPSLYYRHTMYKDRVDLVTAQALSHAYLAGAMLEGGLGREQIEQLFEAARHLSFRMTWTDAQGKVLQDSHIDLADLPELDNHNDRPEIAAALSSGSGISIRHSNSLGIEAVYAAVGLKGGGALRMAVPLADIRGGLRSEMTSGMLFVLGVAGLCLVISAFISAKMRRSLRDMAEVVASIAKGKAQRRLREVPGQEFLPLAYAVNYMADSIEEYVQTTSDQQSQMETILDSMHEGVLVLGPHGNIRRWNRALAAMFSGVEGCVGKPLIEALPVPDLQRRVDAMLAGDEIQPLAFELPKGRCLVANLAKPPQPKDGLGDVGGIAPKHQLSAVIVIHDATEITRLANIRRDFVSNVSHEMRTPLTAIAGYAETLMCSEDIGTEYRRFAEIIRKHAASLAEIIDDMLALAKIEDQEESIEFASVDPTLCLKSAADALDIRLQARGVSLAIRLEPGVVRANSHLLGQVFRNLLENAERYSPEKGVIRVFSAKRGAEVEFIVCDDGPGIPREAHSRVFERFYQVRPERNSGTSGIGLAICKHIIERHGGRIWVQSPFHAVIDGQEISASTGVLFTLPASGV